MTPEEQRIAIHESLGWVKTPHKQNRDFEHVWKKGDRYCFALPAYDLEDMQEAIYALKSHNQRRRFVISLRKVCHTAGLPGVEEELLLITATAAQRREAFLRTIGKWRDA